MAQLFVQPDSEVKVTLFIACLKGDAKKVVADLDKDKLKEVYGEELDDATVEEQTAWFRLPTYFDNTLIAGAAMSIGNDGVQINPSILRLKRMVALIKKWTFKGNDGLPVVPNERSVASLHPSVATMLGMGLEQQLDLAGF